MKALKTAMGFEVNILVTNILCPFRQGQMILVITFPLNVKLYTIGVQTAWFFSLYRLS